MRISADLHQQQPWIAHQITDGFDLVDLWEFPIKANASKQEDFTLFRSCFAEGMEQLSRKGIAGFLFKLRMAMGRVFGWDTETASKPALDEKSIRARYESFLKEQQQEIPPIERGGDENFHMVYATEQESLSEIANKTVHAAMHLGWVSLNEDQDTARLAVYVKTQGWFGRAYMKCIEPFRHLIVYPAMIRAVAKAWQRQTTTSR